MENKGRSLVCFVVLIVLAAIYASQAADITVFPGQRIQEAIDAAHPMDVVFVEKGLYFENLNITKEIALVGIGKPTVNAGATGNAITLHADGVNITGFKIRNSQMAGIAVLSENNLIKNNDISSCNDGIRAENSLNNSIKGNSINNNTNGITLFRSHKNLIEDNDIRDNKKGESDDCGIYLAYSDYNTISDNQVTDNGDCSIFMLSSINNLIANNNISSNRWYGLSLSEFSNGNLIARNLVMNNQNGGIYLENSRDNAILDNIAQRNGNGIYLSCNSNNNSLENNSVFENEKGINLAFHSSNNTITRNNAVSNKFGIHVTLSSGWNRIFDNNLIDNGYNAYDMGMRNRWDNGSVGNYYSDLGSIYNIPGGSGVDRHPLPKQLRDDPGKEKGLTKPNDHAIDNE